MPGVGLLVGVRQSPRSSKTAYCLLAMQTRPQPHGGQADPSAPANTSPRYGCSTPEEAHTNISPTTKKHPNMCYSGFNPSAAHVATGAAQNAAAALVTEDDFAWLDALDDPVDDDLVLGPAVAAESGESSQIKVEGARQCCRDLGWPPGPSSGRQCAYAAFVCRRSGPRHGAVAPGSSRGCLKGSSSLHPWPSRALRQLPRGSQQQPLHHTLHPQVSRPCPPRWV